MTRHPRHPMPHALALTLGATGRRNHDLPVTIAWGVGTAIIVLAGLATPTWGTVAAGVALGLWVHHVVEAWRLPRAGMARVEIVCPAVAAEEFEMQIRLALVAAEVRASADREVGDHE